MNLLANPVVIKGMVVFIAAVAAFILGVWLMRRMRQQITEEATPAKTTEKTLALATYEGVIAQLRSQEQELQRLRQQATDRAEASESLSAAVLSNLPSGVLLFDSSSLVRQANAAARQLLGYASISHLHARHVFRGVRPASEFAETGMDISLPQMIETCLRSGAAVPRAVVEYSTPSGESRVLAVTATPVPNGAACLLTDLTEISRLSHRLRMQENMASLGEMSAGIAHEFKNSLATISGYAQMLAADTQGQAHDFASRIETEIGALSRIVTEFLQFARPQEIRRQPIDLRELLTGCAQASGVELHLDVADDARELNGDPTALKQAFSNLLRNSAEAAADAAPRVEARAVCEDGTVQVTLRDNGCGIPPEQLAKIFIPFFTTKAAGTGLGLALVQRIVAQHGGAITASSDSTGTVFTLSFPQRKEAAAAENGAKIGQQL
ncbi:MAG TPA: ATP-binding protein [Terriglobales bacterium]|nr:ATP-binding protein [Terriglobales bacterium]